MYSFLVYVAIATTVKRGARRPLEQPIGERCHSMGFGEQFQQFGSGGGGPPPQRTANRNLSAFDGKFRVIPATWLNWVAKIAQFRHIE